jgi:hypothetical protein
MAETLDAADLAEAGLVRASDLLELLHEQLQCCGHGNDRVAALAAAARREVDDAVLLMPAIGRIALLADGD